MTEARHSSTLTSIVEGLIEALETLSGDLNKERAALTQRTSADDLEHIAMRKSMAVEAVASLYTRMREALVSSTGDGNLEAAMGHLRIHAPQLSGRVERLVELTRACQSSNQENGALIGAGLRGTQGALDTLRTLSAAGSSNTYSASGHANTGNANASQLAVRA